MLADDHPDPSFVSSGVRREEQREAHLHTPGSGYAGQVRERLQILDNGV